MDIDTPYFVTIGDFNCRAWYPGQPVHCTICREVDHRSHSCPLSGLCRRCHKLGHMTRECGQPWGAIHPGTEVLFSSVPLAENDDDADHVPPSEASSGSSVAEDDAKMMSGDHEVAALRLAALPPSPPPDTAPVPVSVSDAPSAPVSVPYVPSVSNVPAPDVPPAPSVPVSDTSKPPTSSAPVSSAASTLFRGKTDPVLLSALGDLSGDAVTRMSSKDVADFVSRLIVEQSLSTDSRSYMTNYVLHVQRKFSRKDVKKPLDPLKPLKPLKIVRL